MFCREKIIWVHGEYETNVNLRKNLASSCCTYGAPGHRESIAILSSAEKLLRVPHKIAVNYSSQKVNKQFCLRSKCIDTKRKWSMCEIQLQKSLGCVIATERCKFSFFTYIIAGSDAFAEQTVR